MQRMVALKVMHEHLASQPAFQERFQQEARTSAMLFHPGIVRSYYFDQEGRLHFIVMEYVGGPNLRQKLDQLPGAKPPCRWARQPVLYALWLRRLTMHMPKVCCIVT